MKKLISILLVLAMVLTLAPMALASEEAAAEEIEEELVEEVIGEPIDEPAEEAPDVEPEPIAEEPALDGAVVSVSGTLNAYQFSDDAELKLTGDTTLIINADKKLKRIFGDYALHITVESGKTLTVNNTDGHAISVSYFLADGAGTLALLASRDGLNVDTNINISGLTLIVNSGVDSIYSRNGYINLMGTRANIRSTGGSAIFADKGSITLSGDITAETTDDDADCIHSGRLYKDYICSGDITFKDGTFTVTAEEVAVYSYAGSIYISGNLTVASKKSIAIWSSRIEGIVGSDGAPRDSIKIENAVLEANGKLYGIDCGGNIVIMNSEISASGSKYAIYAYDGFFTGSGLAVLTPSAGKIKGDTVVDSSGKTAKTVIIALPRITGKAELSYPGDRVYVGDMVQLVLSDVPTRYSIQWERSENGGSYQDISGAIGETYTIRPEDGGCRLRARVTADGCSGALYTTDAYVYSRPALSGGVKTVSRVIYYGDTISCTLTGDAADIPASKLRYQWQTSPDKSAWTDVSGATSASWQTPSTGTTTTFARVVLTADGYTGQLVSDYHALNVKTSTTTALEGSVTIRQTSEAETSFELGKAITGSFRNTAGIVSTAPSLRYQWQRSLNNANWTDIPGATGTTYTPTNADEGYWLRMKVTSIYSVGELFSDSKQAAPKPPTLTFAADAKSVKASGGYEGLYARVALVLDNGGVSGLYVTQATINSDGTILIPEFKVPGLKVKGVNVALVPTLADIQSSTPNVVVTASKMLGT